ncbi:MAG: cytochrome c oxidase subunit II [Phycisphaerales bacterium]|nr:cytochrome c oxidase subunit II [Phycisphaerales bacterium]
MTPDHKTKLARAASGLMSKPIHAILLASIALLLTPSLNSFVMADEVATVPSNAPVCDGAAPWPTMFAPRSAPAQEILNITWLVIGIVGALGIIVMTMIIFSIIRYRYKEGDDETEPAQIYGSNPIELAWTILPTLIVFVLFMVSARGIFEIEKETPPEGSLEVTVVGHRWWWEFEYPEYGFVTANELHIPIGDDGTPIPTFLSLQSADVIHSFWVPQLAGKTDVVPNRDKNHLWLQPNMAGKYLGQCAEYCGGAHANMLITVIVEPESEFKKWVANQQKSAAVVPAATKGRHIFERTACINCHTVRGTVANGTFAPDLTHFMSRSILGAGAAPNNPKTLRQWVFDPQTIKPGCDMPAMKLTNEEIDLVCDYLETLK